jgi:hypothetical protein
VNRLQNQDHWVPLVNLNEIITVIYEV